MKRRGRTSRLAFNKKHVERVPAMRQIRRNVSEFGAGEY